MNFLTKCFSILTNDIKTIFKKDPAANNIFEVILLYPGFHALIAYRFAHKLHTWRIPFIPRFISQIMRIFTGIEIHPAATIGKNFFIDHGMGVVIGATTIICEDVLIYQGVTLGGTGKDTGKRHPTIESHVTIGAGATILGDITIGSNSNVGAGSVVISDVPSNATVVGIPGRIVMERVYIQGQLLHNKIPDPISCEIIKLKEAVRTLQEQIETLQTSSSKENV